MTFKILPLILIPLALADAQAPAIAGCPAFPTNNIWNVPVDGLALHPNSAGIVAAIGSDLKLRLDDTIPINVVSAATPRQNIPAGSVEDDPGEYPTPATFLTEVGSDAHTLMVDRDSCILYELFATAVKNGVWSVESKAKWDLRSNALRPDGWTSADAAGLPMVPGILRYDEILSGAVNHALRFTAPNTFGFTYVWPARHYASHKTDPNLPRMGERLRLKAGVDIGKFSPTNQIILKALKKYGVILSDNGLAWAMQHDQDSRWNADDLVALHDLLGSSMEVVDATVLLSDPDSGLAVIPPPPGVFVSDKLGRKTTVPFGAGISLVDGALVATGPATGGGVNSVNGRQGDVTLGIADISGLGSALDGKQSALGYTPERPLTFTGPLVRAGDAVSCPTCAETPGTGSAELVKVDATTMGSWRGVYGRDGRRIAGEREAIPGYVKVTPIGLSPVEWADNTADIRAPEKAAGGRVAAGWKTDTSASIHLEFADKAEHQIALYLLDWDGNGPRSETVTVTDAFGKTLDTHRVSRFENGKYLVWRVSGHIIVTLEGADAAGAVASALFFH